MNEENEPFILKNFFISPREDAHKVLLPSLAHNTIVKYDLEDF